MCTGCDSSGMFEDMYSGVESLVSNTVYEAALSERGAQFFYLFLALADIPLCSDQSYPFQLGRFRSAMPHRLKTLYKYVIIPCSAINP